MDDDPSRFPDVRLRPRGTASRRLLERGVTNLRTAIRWVHELPYGRPSDRTDYLAVPTEGVGTCSTKHALLARVCEEQGVEGVRLTLGIYDMTERNTPGVGPVLAEYGLDALPEAHCYLRYDGSRFDFTSVGADGDPIDGFHREETIRPVQLGEYKRRRHRAFLAAWAESLEGEFDRQDLWEIREECIAALSDSNAARTATD